MKSVIKSWPSALDWDQDPAWHKKSSVSRILAWLKGIRDCPFKSRLTSGVAEV